MRPQTRYRLVAFGSLIVAVSALVAALGALVNGALAGPSLRESTESFEYSYSPGELRSEGEKAARGLVRVSGIVKPGTVLPNEERTRLTFEIADRQETDAPGIKVSVPVSPGQALREGTGVVAEGLFEPPDRFVSTRMIVEHRNEDRAAGQVLLRAGEVALEQNEKLSFPAAVAAALALARKGDPGPPGPRGDPGPSGDAGPPGAGWADAGAHLVSTNIGNVGIGTAAPVAKLDVNGEVNATGLQYQGTKVLAVERSGMVADVARGIPPTIMGGAIQGAGPTSEYGEDSCWRTTVFPAQMMVDLGRPVPFVVQIAWESAWRGNAASIPEWQGSRAYVLEHSLDGRTWTYVPPVAPVEGDLFVHTLSPPPGLIRFIRLEVRSPRASGNAVHISMFRAFSYVAGDATAIDARRLYTPPGIGARRLWGEARPGTFRYGTAGVEEGLCVNAAAGIRFGLSKARVFWEGSAAACPAGTWVCTLAERGTAPCDTARPDSKCDTYYRNGQCEDNGPFEHWGHVADSGAQRAYQEGLYVNETGVVGKGSGGSFSMPVWCCTR